jgi:hypothetical protein
VWSGIQPYYDVVTKRLPGGAVAVLIVSKDSNPLSVTLPLSLFQLGAAARSADANTAYKARDIWARQDISGTFKSGGNWTVNHLPAHDSVFLKFTPL